MREFPFDFRLAERTMTAGMTPHVERRAAMKSFTFRACLLILALLPAAGCRQSNMGGIPSAAPQMVQEGAWGGDNIGMDVTSTGATVEFDCAHGTLDSKLLLSDSGHFNAEGLYFQEQGGPAPEPGKTMGVPASYEGAVVEEQMTLTVTNLDTQQKIGTYSLTFGGAPRVMKCL